MYSVLLVEDEDIIRKGIKHSVPWEEHNCIVIGEARNGIEGKDLIQKLNPNIVITDINMPVMDGLQMIAETKCQNDYVAIILTGYSDFEYAKEAIKNGVSDYILKPLNMEEIAETLERAALECKNISVLRKQNESVGELKNISLFCNTELKEASDDPVVEQILKIIAENYSKKITLTDLSDILHYSDRYINQKFQKALGTTVIEYLNRYRIQKALSFLQEDQIPISDIGWECGIGDYKYFNHVFKKYIGCSPKEYKIKIR
ncbi:two-component system response regulator YesN [Hydrogenoanaerobacterium saccharovorans]|uniref:Stage 0 sporulation protein A homolog n=1 Tax=Hydrogenoanaerobacterium saccharovorans TaxID=474960 RepID=A0A1H7Z2Y8_9FIRM|nr:response regulator [Hydrogenoanaerobacterium saccharovorans]RPF48861.1 two-component system response regulator YesN [Hydrogenoanaerobacterium saccharovorans]SEM52551.1 two-component system, response regulator YesN [Hydrogenoanaerobacterium saccharovorans]